MLLLLCLFVLAVWGTVSLQSMPSTMAGSSSMDAVACAHIPNFATAPMLELPAMVDGRATRLQVLDSGLRVPLEGGALEMPFADVRSLHVKNAERFLLKIRGAGSTVILQFATLGVRDLAKALVMGAVAPYEAVRKTVLDRNLDARALHSSVKRSALKSLADSTAAGADCDPQLYVQRPVADVFSKDFLGALTQPLVDAFVEMNCSLNQFYNHFVTTYFFDIKNPKGSLDRLLAEHIRSAGQDARDVGLNYATRINSYSIMALGAATRVPAEARPARRREVEFQPAIPFDTAPPEAASVPAPRAGPLGQPVPVCTFEPVDVEACPAFQHDPKDFELARDICRVVYRQRGGGTALADAMDFSRDFREMLLGRYGPECMAYVERLLPGFYGDAG